MRVLYGSIELADGVETHIADERISGAQSVQPATFIRAAYGQPIARGNRVNSISFKVVYGFDNNTDAQAFVFTHESSLPASAELNFDSDNQITGANAVLTNLDITRRGVRVDVSYQFAAGKFESIATEGQLEDVLNIELFDVEGNPLFTEA